MIAMFISYCHSLQSRAGVEFIALYKMTFISAFIILTTKIFNVDLFETFSLKFACG